MGLRKNLKNMASSFVVEKNTSLRFGINSPDKKQSIDHHRFEEIKEDSLNVPTIKEVDLG